MAYLEGPDRHHASYSIRVKKKDLKILQQEFNEEIVLKDINEDELFSQFCALVRINETVSKVIEFFLFEIRLLFTKFFIKEVVLCYVIYDTTDDDLDFSKPTCLQKMSILEILVNRWIPKENRDDKIPEATCFKTNAASTIQGYFESFDDLDD